MAWLGGKNRRSSRTLEKIIFGPINALLSLLVEKTPISKRIFDFFGRVLPTPKTIVRGVPIKIILPLHQVGVYNTYKDWEKREPEVLDWIDGFEEGCTFFDIGASFGTETLYAALKRNGPERIVAFDLSLEASFNLAYNISLNNINNVDQYFMALSDKIKLIQFNEPSNYYYVEKMDKYSFLSFNTISISLDDFVKLTDLYPDYIKIDVDGPEQSVLSGMAETVKNKRLKSVVIEVSDTSELPITEFFQEAGFKIASERRWEENERYFKNIIFTRNEFRVNA
jgi:FkbM family methyltransferase